LKTGSQVPGKEIQEVPGEHVVLTGRDYYTERRTKGTGDIHSGQVERPFSDRSKGKDKEPPFGWRRGHRRNCEWTPNVAITS
jgi:hypothetical protein